MKPGTPRGVRPPFGNRLRTGWFRGLLAAAAVLSPAAGAMEYPWVYLVPQNDSRDAEMCRQDEAQSLNTVAVINQQEELFDHHLLWRKVAIKDLLPLDLPFCEMHFDAVRPFSLTPEEKKILTEYLQRGGFILFFIDTYPYDEEEFWPVTSWPIIDFIAKELPAADHDFSSKRVTDDFPIFRVHYRTQTADMIRHELTGNPNTPNRTVLFYQNRLCCFVMGQYSVVEGGRWVRMERPFPGAYSFQLKSYQLVVNIYTYSVVR
jgi:hypothetical protein